MDRLEAVSKEVGVALEDIEFAKAMNSRDPLAHFRDEFEIPTVNQVTSKEHEGGDSQCTYLCGNSLGLLPKKVRQVVNEELDEWAHKGVVGHHVHSKNRPWINYRDIISEKMAPLFGAKPIEVGAMNSLTVNVHLMLAAFYKPTESRYKILIEKKAFPSDHYAVESQVEWHKLAKEDAMLLAAPREGEYTLRTEDILDLIEREGDSISVVMLSGIQYYTGQVFEMEKITKAAHAKGCIVGWDLAHAAGNIPVKLHDWDVDFACWCTYKYMNTGAGGIAGFFVNERYANDTELNRLRGWWSHEKKTRFEMSNELIQGVGAEGFEISNPPVLTAAALLGSLQVFEQTSMEELRSKSVLMTTYLEYLLEKLVGENVNIITPKEHRGAQLSLIFDEKVFDKVFSTLMDSGVICDERKPNCIRIAPIPLYNNFTDVWNCVDIIRKTIASL